MDFRLVTFAALCVFFTAASSAPVRDVRSSAQQDACTEVKISSLDLNHYAKLASVKARNGSTDLAAVSSSLVWMEAKDMCDPESLKHKPMPCVSKIFTVLTSYSSAVEMISAFDSCSEFTSIVKPALRKLHRDMSKCVRSLGGKHEKEPHVSKVEPEAVDQWKEAFLCHYVLDRVFSFSILAARVFAVGHPAHHDEGSSQKCW
ncbi:uncharacterized protein [Nothobranchius furzeri]|uniref:uncharacterized protein n=1 Tax=Nothobranchius furzeri TaxID=105023 RepID=UPI00390487F7